MTLGSQHSEAGLGMDGSARRGGLGEARKLPSGSLSLSQIGEEDSKNDKKRKN